MRLKNTLFLIFILLFVIFSVNVIAQPIQFTPQQQQIASATLRWVDQITFWFFREHVSGLDLVLYLVVFIILAILFCDALINFSPLSRKASIAIGLLLTFITSFMGGIKSFARLMLGIAGGFGVFGAAFSLALAIGAYFLIHWVFNILSKFTKKSVKKKMDLAAEGAESLASFAKRLSGKK